MNAKWAKPLLTPPTITPTPPAPVLIITVIIRVIIIVTSVSSSSDAPIMTIISFCLINRHNDA